MCQLGSRAIVMHEGSAGQISPRRPFSTGALTTASRASISRRRRCSCSTRVTRSFPARRWRLLVSQLSGRCRGRSAGANETESMLGLLSDKTGSRKKTKNGGTHTLADALHRDIRIGRQVAFVEEEDGWPSNREQ